MVHGRYIGISKADRCELGLLVMLPCTILHINGLLIHVPPLVKINQWLSGGLGWWFEILLKSNHPDHPGYRGILGFQATQITSQPLDSGMKKDEKGMICNFADY